MSLIVPLRAVRRQPAQQAVVIRGQAGLDLGETRSLYSSSSRAACVPSNQVTASGRIFSNDSRSKVRRSAPILVVQLDWQETSDHW